MCIIPLGVQIAPERHGQRQAQDVLLLAAAAAGEGLEAGAGEDMRVRSRLGEGLVFRRKYAWFESIHSRAQHTKP